MKDGVSYNFVTPTLFSTEAKPNRPAVRLMPKFIIVTGERSNLKFRARLKLKLKLRIKMELHPAPLAVPRNLHRGDPASDRSSLLPPRSLSPSRGLIYETYAVLRRA